MNGANEYAWGYKGGNTISVEFNIKDCIEEAKARKEENEIWVAEYTTHIPKFDGDDVVEMLRNRADCDYGEDLVNDWLLCSNEKDLAEKLNETLNKWLIKNNEIPNFGDTNNEKFYNIETGKEIK